MSYLLANFPGYGIIGVDVETTHQDHEVIIKTQQPQKLHPRILDGSLHQSIADHFQAANFTMFMEDVRPAKRFTSR